MPELEDYLALIPPYNAQQPDFMAVLTTLLQPLIDGQRLISGFNQDFDLDTAIGAQLDVDGVWIGRSRYISTPISDVYFSWEIEGLGWEQGFWQGAFDPDDGVSRLDDEIYRKLLYAKAAANQSDGSLAAVVDIMDKLLEGEGVEAVVYDNQDMTMTVEIHGVIQNLMFRSIIVGGYLPIKPAGVQINFLIADPVQFPVSATITGIGGVSARAGLVRFGSAIIHGVGSVSVGGLAAGFSPLNGVGTVIANAVARVLGSASVSAIGGVQAFGSTRQTFRSTIAGVGGVSAVASAAQHASATIAGVGSVSAAPVILPAGSLFINAVGTATATANMISRFGNSAIIAGVGTAIGTARVRMAASATIGGVGSVTLSPGQNLIADPVTIAGVGSVIGPPARLRAAATMTGAGVGSVTASARARLLGRATIGGVGSVSADTASVFWGHTNAVNIISNGGLRVSKQAGSGNDYTTTIGNRFITSTKKYWELRITTKGAGSDLMFGIARVDFVTSNTGDFARLGGRGGPPFTNIDSWGWFTFNPYNGNGGEIVNQFPTYNDMEGYQQGDRICIALDADNWKWWGRVNNGFWNAGSGGTQDPATNQGGHDIVYPEMKVGGVGPGVTMWHENDVVDAFFAASGWSYTAPSGFNAL